MRLFEERLYRRAYARAQGSRTAFHLAQIDSQLQRLGARAGADTSGFYRDPYFNAYVLGVLDSITKFYETELRQGGPAKTRLLWHMAGRNAPARAPQAAPRRDTLAQDLRAPLLVMGHQAG
jgi:hypothetical protein